MSAPNPTEADKRVANQIAVLVMLGRLSQDDLLEKITRHRTEAQDDLLEALEGYISDCTNDECERCITARAAIAKAKGGEA